MSNKSTKAEIQERVTIIYQMLMRRDPRPKILHFGSEKWGVSHRQVEYYIEEANRWIKEENDKFRQSALEAHIAFRRDLFNKAYRSEQWHICMALAKDEAQLLALYPTPDKINEAIALVTKAGFKVVDPTEEDASAVAKNKADDMPTANSGQGDEPVAE